MIIDGRKIAQGILNRVAAETSSLSFRPLFCDILVGNDPVQFSYVNIKGKTAKKVGFDFLLMPLPEDSGTGKIVEKISELNIIPRMSGLIVQLPLPARVNKSEVVNNIDPRVDVDCLGSKNTEAFYGEGGGLVPPTAGAIMEILDSLPVNLKEKRIVVVGKGELVGRPVHHLLESRGLLVQQADRDTSNIGELLSGADIVISGTGQPGLIKGDVIKEGSIVLDAGTAESAGGIVGDVEFESVAPKVSYLSPVPGGVGPVTVAKLLENVLKAAKQK